MKLTPLRSTYIIDIAFALFVVGQLSLRFFLSRMRVEEEVLVSISIVFNFDVALLAVQIREVAVGAGGEALRTSVAVLRNLLVKRIVAHHGDGSHGADRPEEEA